MTTPPLNTFLEERKKEYIRLFPYSGIIIEDDGRKYSLEDIWSFISASISEAWELSIKQSK